MEENRIKKILYVSGSRADFGLMKNVLNRIHKNPEFELEVVATGMHIMSEFGDTIEEIKKEGFKVHKIQAIYEKDDKQSMSKFVGIVIQNLTKLINEIKPDLILLLGDRAEMLAGAVVGTYLSIPVAHIHGGDISSTVDETVRHAITKLSNIHFAATKKSAERIIKMGEKSSNVFVVGAPGIEEIVASKLIDKEKLFDKYKINAFEPLILVVQHPVTLEFGDSDKQIKETLDAIVELQCQSIIIYPNADAGGRKMIELIKGYSKKYQYLKAYKNLSRSDYLSLMKYSNAIVGNSSSGIIESPYFRVPAVNIGSRQKNREKSLNVIDTEYNKEKIKKAIERALNDKNFKNKIKNLTNIYGDGETSKRIVDIISKIKINSDILQKHLSY